MKCIWYISQSLIKNNVQFSISFISFLCKCSRSFGICKCRPKIGSCSRLYTSSISDSCCIANANISLYNRLYSTNRRLTNQGRLGNTTILPELDWPRCGSSDFARFHFHWKNLIFFHIFVALPKTVHSGPTTKLLRIGRNNICPKTSVRSTSHILSIIIASGKCQSNT